MRYWLLGLAIGLTCALAQGSALAQSGGDAVVWQRYDVALGLQPDGSLNITETQTIRFRGTFRHGYRVVPLDRTTGISQVSVSEVRNGQEVPYTAGSERAGTFSTSREPDGLAIDWWFGPTQGTETRTFVLRYVAQGATRIYADTAQVFWKAIYAERGGPVEAGSVSLGFPSAVDQSAVMSATYLYEASGRPTETTAPRWVDARTLRADVSNLPSGVGVEIRAQMPRTVVPNAQAPPWQADADRADWIEQSVAPIGSFLALLLTLAIGVGGGVAVFLLWYSRGREPHVDPVPGTLPEPPSDLPAPLVGTLVDGVADLQDAVAILVDLAQRDVLSLKHEGGDVRVSLHTATDDPALRSYERVFLTALFGSGVSSGEIMLSSARPRFASAVPVLEERLYAAIADEGLFVANPETTRRRYTGLGWALVVGGVALAILGGLLLGWAVPIAWLPGVALALIGLVLVWVARAMPRRTPRGALEAARWQAFRRHLLEDEQDASEEASLPYAVAFGIDRDFLRRLEPVAAAPVAPVSKPWVSGQRHLRAGWLVPHRRRPAAGFVARRRCEWRWRQASRCRHQKAGAARWPRC